MIKSELLTPTLRIMMLPDDINSGGAIFVGSVLKYALIAAQIEAAQKINKSVKLTSITDLDFPILPNVGDIVDFYAEIDSISESALVVSVKFILKDKQIGSTKIRFTTLRYIHPKHNDRLRSVA